MSRVAELEAGRLTQYEEPFAEYVGGRTIAIVGPGPVQPGDLDAAIDHDLVYVVAGHAKHHEVRPNILGLNRHGMVRLLRGQAQYQGHDWIVAKNGTHGLPNARRARYSPHLNLNQVPIALVDLTHFKPADVSVYGADLYLGGPGNAYMNAYDNRDAQKQWNGVKGHTPTLQHETVAGIRATTGWFDRSPRFAAIADLDTDDYWEQLRARWVPAIHGVAA